jgi:hypothetical protein
MQDREYCVLQAREARAMAAIAEPTLGSLLLRMADHWERVARSADAAPMSGLGMPGLGPKRSRRVWALRLVALAGDFTKILRGLYRRLA